MVLMDKWNVEFKFYNNTHTELSLTWIDNSPYLVNFEFQISKAGFYFIWIMFQLLICEKCKKSQQELVFV